MPRAIPDCRRELDQPQIVELVARDRAQRPFTSSLSPLPPHRSGDHLRRVLTENPGVAIDDLHQVDALDLPLVVRETLAADHDHAGRWLLRGIAHSLPHGWPTSETTLAPSGHGRAPGASPAGRWRRSPGCRCRPSRTAQEQADDREHASDRKVGSFAEADRQQHERNHVRHQPHVGIGRAEHHPRQQHEALSRTKAENTRLREKVSWRSEAEE